VFLAFAERWARCPAALETARRIADHCMSYREHPMAPMTTHRSENPPLETLLAALREVVPPAAIAWLEGGVSHLGARSDRADALAIHSAGAQRRLGAEPLSESPVPIETACGTLDAAGWSRGDAGRACLLLAAAGDAAPGWTELVIGIFRHGDEAERAAVARALCLLPEPRALSDVALEVGRANSLRLYAALALDNPYPAACYEEHAFNQVVLKCLFNGLPIARVVGLARRANPELALMCERYVGERVAAAREVPTDIWLALAPHAGPSGLALTLEYLVHADPRHRYHAAIALGRRSDAPGIAEALAERLGKEADKGVRGALADAVRA
jgi:hypothetical protein